MHVSSPLFKCNFHVRTPKVDSWQKGVPGPLVPLPNLTFHYNLHFSRFIEDRCQIIDSDPNNYSNNGVHDESPKCQALTHNRHVVVLGGKA